MTKYKGGETEMTEEKNDCVENAELAMSTI
jgi:hypothetical protein